MSPRQTVRRPHVEQLKCANVTFDIWFCDNRFVFALHWRNLLEFCIKSYQNIIFPKKYSTFLLFLLINHHHWSNTHRKSLLKFITRKKSNKYLSQNGEILFTKWICAEIMWEKFIFGRTYLQISDLVFVLFYLLSSLSQNFGKVFFLQTRTLIVLLFSSKLSCW